MTLTADRLGEPVKTHPVLRLWWLSPVVVSLFVGAASILPTLFIGDQEFRTLWGTPKSITIEVTVLFGCGVLALCFGALIGIVISPSAAGLRAPWPGLSDRLIALLRRASTVLTALTVTGYFGFALLIVKAGLGPAQLFAGAPNDGSTPVRDLIGTVPGVTTLTQAGIAAVVISAILLAHGFSRAELAKLLIVVGFAVPRAYIFTERLAILELIVPVTLILAARLSFHHGLRRRFAQLIPFGSLFAIVVVFGTFEYFRSWTFYRLHSSASFVDFAMSRFAGYYATAINNGQLILDHLGWPGRVPYDTLEGFWTAPVIEQTHLYERVAGHIAPYSRQADGSMYFNMLDHYGNQEFNNPSGYVGPFVDYGQLGGLVFFFIAGLAAGLLYQAFCQGKVFGLLLYPVVFTGLVELPRYIYWSQGRTAYTWIPLFIVIALAASAQRKDRHAKT